MKTAERKHVLRLACACDRLEFRLLCDRHEEAHPLAGVLPGLVPWIAAFSQLKRQWGGKLTGGSLLGKIARILVALV